MQDIDISGKKLNRAMGAVTESEKARIEADTTPPERTVPPDLAGATFAHRVGLNDETEPDPLLVKAKNAYHSMTENLDELHRRERAILADGASTPSFKVMAIDGMARNRADAPAKKLDDVRQDLKATINTIDSDIDRTFRSHLTPEGQREIREYVRSLSDKQRRQFLADADNDTTAAVLTGKPYLSGMSSAEANALRHRTVQARFPEQIKRRQKLERAMQEIDQGWTLYLKHATKLYNEKAGEIKRRYKAAQDAAA